VAHVRGSRIGAGGAGRQACAGLPGGKLVADTRRPLLVFENPHYPAYYLPLGDVVADLTDTGERYHSPSRGDAARLDVVAGAQRAPGAALHYGDSPIEALRDAVRIEWDAMDEWLEEDEPVYTHPRSPYSRVDILASSRHVVVELDGHTLADSHQPRILFETGLPPSLLPAAHRPVGGAPAAVVHGDPLPLQGVGNLLVDRVGGNAPRGPGLDLPDAAA